MSTKKASQLILAPLDEFIKEGDHVLLAVWCQAHPRLGSARTLPSPYANSDAVVAAGRQSQQLYRSILPGLAECLNDLHDVNYSLREWEVLAGPWLQLFIGTCLDRYLRLQLAWRSCPELECTLLDERSCAPAETTIGLAYALSTDRYNLQLMSRLLRAMGRKCPEKSLPAPALDVAAQAASLKQRTLHLAFRAMARACAAANNVVLLRDSYLPRRAEIKLAAQSRGRIVPWLSPFRPLPASAPDMSLRRDLSNMAAGEDEFEALLARLLPLELPVCLIEDFHRYRRAAEKEYPRSVAAVCSANAWHYDETFKHAAVRYMRAGSKLLGVQHGGNYGALALMAAEDHEISIVDSYFSWGWTREDAPPKVKPMPAAKLVGQSAMKADNAAQHLLWVTTAASRYLVQHPYQPEYFQTYLDWQSRFLAKLAPDWKMRLRLRPHYEDNGWNLIQRLQAQEPALQLEDWRTPFRASLAQCRLYICDHLSTTFLEALSARKPTLLFWNEESNRLRPEAEPHYQRLREAGILFHSPEDAAQAVQLAAQDVEIWWNKPERVAAVDSFCACYARSEHNALTVWREELDQARARRKVAG